MTALINFDIKVIIIFILQGLTDKELMLPRRLTGFHDCWRGFSCLLLRSTHGANTEFTLGLGRRFAVDKIGTVRGGRGGQQGCVVFLSFLVWNTSVAHESAAAAGGGRASAATAAVPRSSTIIVG